MEQLVNFIIRPPRAEYNVNDDLLEDEFMLKGKLYQRKDLEVKNSRGDVLQCSHYMPIVTPQEKPLPCVIYCHGNSGSRADASEAAIILLPSNITVFTLDFSGSGLSGGEHVTLGWNEKDDLRAVVDYLRADGNVSLIGLWGRSMGAVTSLMYGAEDPSIAGMVLDSPFSDLVDLMMELVDTYKFRFPKFTVKFAIQFMRRSIQKKAKFDIMDLNTIKVAKSCFVPVLLGHAIEDDFINPHHSDRIFEAYMGDKNIIKFEGDHNSPRPQFYFDSINIFFHNVLQPPEDEVGGTYFDTMHDYFGKVGWDDVHKQDYNYGPSTASKGPDGSTADAINEIRSRRPMSRTEVPSDFPDKDNKSISEDQETDDTRPSSSSNMISFELANGQPYGPHFPTTMDDDQYVEYALDDSSDFPCTAEEEERMLMEAVMMSLKDLEMRPHHAEEQPHVPSDSLGSSEKDDINTASTTENCPSQKIEATTTSNIVTGHHNLAHNDTSTDTSASSVGYGLDTSSSAASEINLNSSVLSTGLALDISLSESAGTSFRSEISGSAQGSAAADISDNTKATLTVERNPGSNNIMDGLMQFFRNGR